MKSDRHLDIMRVNIAFLFGATYYQHAPQAFSSMKADVTFHSKPDESKNHHPPSFLLPSPGELFPSEKSSTSSSARFLSLSLFIFPDPLRPCDPSQTCFSRLVALLVEAILHDSTACFSSRGESIFRTASGSNESIPAPLFESEQG